MAIWKRTTLIGTGALVALAVLTGCGGSNETEHPATHTSSATAAAEAHNDADVMFAQHMIPHHQQAIEMSDMLLAKQGIDPRVIDLANQIKAAQGPEIQQMQGWLTQWDSPAMPPMSGHDMPGMQGMMSDADMTALTNAQGAEASKLFLMQMISHHEGAITMAQSEIKDGQYPAAIDLAKTIETTQQKEIDTMRGLLATL
ncbi:DUF305 domain-containing protein [Mycobacterium sp. 3519A]|uniref:DUF305 domain-containing protein n=1 Tax=Mycobacterium sp. 3519A TaxID=2057184 RepID=UPI000C7DA3C0|nr:DUF305 domain-containing protein [Mycobacterium sp. 3519A]